MFWIDTEIGWYYKKCVPFLSSSSYAKHGRNAVNIPLANSSIFGPDNWINSRIQSMAVNWINGFLDWAWFIRMLHISDIFVPDGSLLMPFKNSDSSVSHLFHKQFWALEEHFRTYNSMISKDYTYVVWISTHWSSSIWKRPSRISGRYEIIFISGTAFNTDIQVIMNCLENEFFV